MAWTSYSTIPLTQKHHHQGSEDMRLGLMPVTAVTGTVSIMIRYAISITHELIFSVLIFGFQ
jgi:hypothetical protein